MNMTNDTANISSRTWNVTIPVMLEGAYLMTITATVTAFKVGNQIISALVDGAEATLERAANLLTWAKREGTLTVTETVEEAQPISIGKRVACTLHKDLARMGYSHSSSHYQIAAEALERPVSSLAALSAEEAAAVFGYAQAQMGMSSTRWAA
jgi:hypothetical protein